MSTQIAEIIGRKEFDPHKGEKTIYVDSALHITRFWGGKLNGQMLQLTISNDEGHSYIQLTKNQVEALSIILDKAFNDNIYPSE